MFYGKRFHLSFDKEHATELAQYIPAPPDNGIDLFVEEVLLARVHTRKRFLK